MPPQTDFVIGQVVRVTAGEQAGMVGRIVTIGPYGVSLSMNNGNGGGSFISTLKFQYIEGIPMAQGKPGIKGGDRVVVTNPFGSWEGIVLDIEGSDSLIFVMPDGGAVPQWVDRGWVKPRIEAPEFRSIEEADTWAESVRKDQ